MFRRVTVGSFYAGFPELERFSEHERARCVRRAKKRLGLRAVWPWVWLTVSMPSGLVVGVVTADRGMGLIETRIDRAERWLESAVGSSLMLGEVLMILNIGVWMFAIPGGFMLVWRDRQFRAVLRETIESARCLSCGQSLLGLPLLPGGGRARVRCPECGMLLTLEDVGLVPEDLLVRGDQQS